jgi:hypothetical protein
LNSINEDNSDDYTTNDTFTKKSMLNNKYDNEKNNLKGESNFKVFGRKIEALPDE